MRPPNASSIPLRGSDAQPGTRCCMPRMRGSFAVNTEKPFEMPGRNVPDAGATASLMQYLGSWGGMLALLHMGQLGELLRTLRTAIAMAQRNGNNLWFFAFTGIEAWLRTLTLDFDGARRLCEPILEQDLERAARTPKAHGPAFPRVCRNRVG